MWHASVFWGAMKGTPTTAMEMLLSLPPLYIVNLEKTKMVAFKMKCADIWLYHQASKHIGIGNIFPDILFVCRDRYSKIEQDRMTRIIDLDLLYDLCRQRGRVPR